MRNQGPIETEKVKFMDFPPLLKRTIPVLTVPCCSRISPHHYQGISHRLCSMRMKRNSFSKKRQVRMEMVKRKQIPRLS